MNLEKILRGVHFEATRVWPNARFLVLEDLPFYHKARVLLAKNLFIEIRLNARNKRISYALVENEERIAGFDNLGTWHLHPFGKPNTHRRIFAPSPQKVFTYFKHSVQAKNKLK